MKMVAIGGQVMKRLRLLMTWILGCLIISTATSVSAQMNINIYDLAGYTVSGEAGDCIGLATVESGQLKTMGNGFQDENGAWHFNVHEQLINVLIVDGEGNYYRASGTSQLWGGNYVGYTDEEAGACPQTIRMSTNNLTHPIGGNKDLPRYMVHTLTKHTLNANCTIVNSWTTVRSECLD